MLATAEVVDLAAGGRQPGDDGVAEHDARGPAVARDDDAAAADVGAERRRERQGDLRRQALADDAADPRDADDEVALAAHGSPSELCARPLLL